MVHQSECNTTFFPPSEIQVITDIKRIPLLRPPSFLRQKCAVEKLTINRDVRAKMSSEDDLI